MPRGSGGSAALAQYTEQEQRTVLPRQHAEHVVKDGQEYAVRLGLWHSNQTAAMGGAASSSHGSQHSASTSQGGPLRQRQRHWVQGTTSRLWGSAGNRSRPSCEQAIDNAAVVR
ncbi:hypothetical protein DT019_32610 [Streptomyces sp. SDr-06]|nr:hypothetical protein DT019_32610 [Streptomyces sp. SDr-06]